MIPSRQNKPLRFTFFRLLQNAPLPVTTTFLGFLLLIRLCGVYIPASVSLWSVELRFQSPTRFVLYMNTSCKREPYSHSTYAFNRHTTFAASYRNTRTFYDRSSSFYIIYILSAFPFLISMPLKILHLDWDSQL